MSGTLMAERLHELFEAQAATVRPSLGEWDDVIVDDLAERRDRRKVWAVSAAAAACVVLMIAIGWAATRTETHVPSDGGNVDLSTNVIEFTADSIVIDVGGQQFSPIGGVDVASDPSPSDPTLELTWMQNGVEMRLNFYFQRDAKSWWVREVRVYDGTSDPDWLVAVNNVVNLGETTGVMATGDFEMQVLGADGAPAGKLTISNMQLRPLAPGCDQCVNLPVPGGPVPTIDTALANVDPKSDPPTP